MKYLFSSLLAVLALAISPVSSAKAATVTLADGASYSYSSDVAPTGDISFSGQTISTTGGSGTVYLSGPNSSSLKLVYNDAAFVTGSVSGSYAEPSGAAGSAYLSVFGSSSSFATLYLDGKYNAFSMEWGSADTYNTLLITYADGTTDTLTGTLLGSTDTLRPNTYFSFIGKEAIESVKLTSSSNAFEVVNLNVSSVPLPAALPLFGSALMGFFGLRRRSRKGA